MNIICVTAANPLQGERIERKGDIPICDIPIYRYIEISRDRDIERPRYRETERSGVRATEKSGDRETERSGDREIGRLGAEIRRRMESK